MSYSKFNKSFLIATFATLSVIAGIQGCSSSDEQATPSGGAAGRASGGSSGKNTGGASGKGSAGETSNGGDAGQVEPNGGTGNVTGGNAGTGNEPGTGGDAGAAGAAGTPGVPTDCDGFLRPCGGLACAQDFDNSTLTKLKNGVLPALP